MKINNFAIPLWLLHKPSNGFFGLVYCERGCKIANEFCMQWPVKRGMVRMERYQGRPSAPLTLREGFVEGGLPVVGTHVAKSHAKAAKASKPDKTF